MRFVIAAALTLVAGGARAESVLLQNDGWTDGAQVYCQDGFVVGEEAAVTLGPLAQAGVVTAIELVFCGAATTETVGVKVYAEDGVAVPGRVRYEGSVALTGADDALQVIDLSGASLTVLGGNSIRVGLTFAHAGVPSVSRDNDGSLQPGRNWINTASSGWIDASEAGLSGDWVIRARVNFDDDTAEPATDDAADADAGCDCAASSPAPWALLALSGLGRRRRAR